MNKYTSFPDLGRSMKMLKFSLELEGVSDQTIIGFVIKDALAKKAPINDICGMILEQGRDNESALMDIVGSDLYNEIKQFYGK